MRVLLVGPTTEGRGGIAAVERVLLRHEKEDLGFRFIATTGPPGACSKLHAFAKAVLGVWRAGIRREAAVAHLNTASRRSFWRKYLISRICQRMGMPYVVQIHGGGFGDFVRKGGVQTRWAAGKFLCGAKRVIVLSEQQKKTVARLGYSASLVVVGNPVEVPNGTFKKDYEEILFLGHIVRKKGVEELVRAMGLVIRGGSGNVRLVMGGTGERGWVERIMEEVGVTGNVELLGWLEGEKKLEYLRRAMIFALPSWVEAFPMSVLEAMAHGCCVVGTPVGALPEIVTEECGVLVPVRNWRELGEGLTWLVNNPKVALRKGAAGRKRVRELFSVERIMDALREVYQEAVLE